MFLSSNNDSHFKGIVFLASYPSKKLNDSYRCLSIYGTNDMVLNKEDYNDNLVNFPSGYKEIVVEGGNHSYFGDYGFQRGDGEATLSKEEQTNIAKDAVVSFIKAA